MQRGATDEMDICVTREAGMLVSTQEGSNDGSTAVNPGPLGRLFSNINTFCHIGPIRVERRRLMQILWESPLKSRGSSAWYSWLGKTALPVSDFLSFLGLEDTIFFFNTVIITWQKKKKSLYIEENPRMKYTNCQWCLSLDLYQKIWIVFFVHFFFQIILVPDHFEALSMESSGFEWVGCGVPKLWHGHRLRALQVDPLGFAGLIIRRSIPNGEERFFSMGRWRLGSS